MDSELETDLLHLLWLFCLIDYMYDWGFHVRVGRKLLRN